MKYAIYDNTGALIEAVNIERVTELPQSAIELTDAQFNDWQNYKREGGQVVYAPRPSEAPVVPQSVTPFQASRALLQFGILDVVESAVAAADRETQLAWNKATTIERNSPFVANMAVVLGLTDAQLDDLFILADTFV